MGGVIDIALPQVSKFAFTNLTADALPLQEAKGRIRV
jgi:hypothetical protein